MFSMNVIFFQLHGILSTLCHKKWLMKCSESHQKQSLNFVFSIEIRIAARLVELLVLNVIPITVRLAENK